MEKICRRQAIKLSGQAFLALTAAMPFMSCLSSSDVSDKVQAKTTWQEFIDRIHLLSEAQFSTNWNENAYVEDVKKLISTLDINDQNIKKFTIQYKNKHKKIPEIHAMHKEQNFMISMLEFEPGEKIPLHDHPDMTGVIHCIEGRINIQNYTLQGETSDSGKLLLKQESSVTFKPGVSGTLTSTFGNIHSLQADKFTRLIDVFTPPYNDLRTKNSKYYRKRPEYYQGIQGMFEAEIIH